MLVYDNAPQMRHILREPEHVVDGESQFPSPQHTGIMQLINGAPAGRTIGVGGLLAFRHQRPDLVFQLPSLFPGFFQRESRLDAGPPVADLTEPGVVQQ